MDHSNNYYSLVVHILVLSRTWVLSNQFFSAQSNQTIFVHIVRLNYDFKIFTIDNKFTHKMSFHDYWYNVWLKYKWWKWFFLYRNFILMLCTFLVQLLRIVWHLMVTESEWLHLACLTCASGSQGSAFFISLMQ